MTQVLLQQSGGAERCVELTPEGHGFALEHDYDVVIGRLQGEAETLTGTRALEFACTALPLAEDDFGAGMPPVVSWLQNFDTDNGQRSDRFLLHLLPGQTCFQGHFPGQPILPGIIQLHWAAKLAQTCLGRPGEPREIVRLKYHNIAVPPRFIELVLESGESPDVQFRVHSADGVHAQGKLVYGGIA